MKIFKRQRTYLAIFFLSVICAIGAIWIERSATSRVDAQSELGLTLEISTPQSRYLKLEPIPLKFKLSNPTAEPITWNGNLDFANDVNLLIHAANSTEFQWKGADQVVCFGSVGTEVLQPDKNKEVQRLINEEFGQRLFAQPGQYQLRVEFTYRAISAGQPELKTILSNPITIDIEEPRGRDRAAYEYLRNVVMPERRRS